MPKIIEQTKKPDCPFYLSIVVSHKKHSEGINLAQDQNIPAVFWNFIEWSKLTSNGRKEYMQTLGYFISQSYYKPDLIVTAGWDLILTLDFLNYFKRNDGYYNVINLHPAPLPDNPTDKLVKLSNDTLVPVIKGEIDQILPQVLSLGLEKWGSTIHFITEKIDEGPVILRSEVEVKPDDNIDSLKRRLQHAEDQILPKAINLFSSGKLKIENGKVVIEDE